MQTNESLVRNFGWRQKQIRKYSKMVDYPEIFVKILNDREMQLTN